MTEPPWDERMADWPVIEDDYVGYHLPTGPAHLKGEWTLADGVLTNKAGGIVEPNGFELYVADGFESRPGPAIVAPSGGGGGSGGGVVTMRRCTCQPIRACGKDVVPASTTPDRCPIHSGEPSNAILSLQGAEGPKAAVVDSLQSDALDPVTGPDEDLRAGLRMGRDDMRQLIKERIRWMFEDLDSPTGPRAVEAKPPQYDEGGPDANAQSGALRFIAGQPCRAEAEGSGPDLRCSETGACVTEWCHPCYARACTPALDTDDTTPDQDAAKATEDYLNSVTPFGCVLYDGEPLPPPRWDLLEQLQQALPGGLPKPLTFDGLPAKLVRSPDGIAVRVLDEIERPVPDDGRQEGVHTGANKVTLDHYNGIAAKIRADDAAKADEWDRTHGDTEAFPGTDEASHFMAQESAADIAAPDEDGEPPAHSIMGVDWDGY